MTREYRAYNLMLGAVLLMIALAPFLVDLPEAGASHGLIRPPVRFVRQHTGKRCPGCGLTRSVVALYDGHRALSRRYQPGGVLVVGVLLVEICLRVVPMLVARSWMLWVDFAQLVVAGLVLRWNL